MYYKNVFRTLLLILPLTNDNLNSMDGKEIKLLLKQAREAIKEKDFKTALKHCKVFCAIFFTVKYVFSFLYYVKKFDSKNFMKNIVIKIYISV